MKAHQGDRIILAASHTDEPTRDGEVLEVRGANGDPPYLVRWADGHTGLMYPGPGSVLRIEGEHVASVPAGTSLSSAGGPPAARVIAAPGTRPCPRSGTRSRWPAPCDTWPTSCSRLRPRTSRP